MIDRKENYKFDLGGKGLIESMLLCICSVISWCKNKNWPTRHSPVCLNTFWYTLWSITVQTHDNVEYFCFIWNPCFYSPIDHVQEPIKKHVQFSLWYSLNIFYFCFEHCRLRWRWLCANWITLFLVNLEVNYKLRLKCQMSLTFRYCNPKHSSWKMLLSVLDS